MKKTAKRFLSFVVAAVLILALGACSSNDKSSSGKESEALNNSSMEKNGYDFSVAGKKTLSEMESAGTYTVTMGNLALYDSLLLQNDKADIDSIKTSADYQRMAKVGITFKNAIDDPAITTLKSCYLYSKDTVYQPYYILYSNGKDAIILFECEDKLSGDLTFTGRSDDEIVICGEDDAKKASEADLSTPHENIYSVSYNASDTSNGDSHFENGNSSYEDMDFEKAECDYLLALNNKDTLSSYTENDVKNNLVLARLQLEKNEDALKMASDLVSNNPLKDGASDDELKNSTGYVINLLVAAHANKLTKDNALEQVKNVTLTDVEKKLNKLADDNPGEFVHFMTALAYNEYYMEMEKTGNDPELELIQTKLDELNKREKKTFDKEDEDIKELKEYLSAKIDSLK